MKRIIISIICLSLLLVSFGIGAFATNNIDNPSNNTENMQNEEELARIKAKIAKELYTRTEKSKNYDFEYLKNIGYKFLGDPYAAKYENVRDYTMLDVDYNQDTNVFVAVIELQYTLNSGKNWHSEYYGYKGSYQNNSISTDVCEILDTRKDIDSFWSKYLNEAVQDVESESIEADSSTEQNTSVELESPTNITEFDIDRIVSTMPIPEGSTNGIDKYGYYPKISVFAIILANNPSTVTIYKDFPEKAYEKFLNSSNPYAFYWNKISGAYKSEEYSLLEIDEAKNTTTTKDQSSESKQGSFVRGAAAEWNS